MLQKSIRNFETQTENMPESSPNKLKIDSRVISPQKEILSVGNNPSNGAADGRHRILVDIHGNLAAKHDIKNEYERERQERIKRNEEVLRQLGLKQLANDVMLSSVEKQQSTEDIPHRAPRNKRERRIDEKPRRIFKTRGQCNTKEQEPSELEKDDQADDTQLLSLEEYFKSIGKDVTNALRTDGTFNGWVCPAVADSHGIPSREVLEASSSKQQAFKPKGRTAAKEKAASQLRTNPNSYFYRLVAPGQLQAQGQWTQEEHDAFMKTAREHGVGDNWGLFASYIGTRVGYQCSAYMREVIVPSGFILDSRFRMTRSGKAVFVGL